MRPKKYFLIVLTLLLIFFICIPAINAKQVENDEKKVCIIPVKGIINNGMEQFIRRTIKEAEQEKVDAIVFEIDTPGGEVRAADSISNRILNTSIPTISFINNEATSAGVIIAISCKKIYMSPRSTIGAAETRPKEEKYISYWTSRLRSVAEETGKDAELIAAMADSDIEIEGVKKKGKILSLTTRQAIKLKLADGITKNHEELLVKEDLKDANIVEKRERPAERLAQVIMNPYITPIILTTGFVGIITEILTPGFGLPGIIGILAFGLFFGVNIMIKAAQAWMIGLFVLGLVLLITEIFIPGFGVFGITGIISCVLSIMFAFSDIKQAFISIIFAFIASCIIIYLLLKYVIKTPILNKVVLDTKQEESKGYTAFYKDNTNLLGREGIALTPLRPSGLGLFGKEKFDVLSNGKFILKGEKIQIIKVEGNKIIVKQKGSDF